MLYLCMAVALLGVVSRCSVDARPVTGVADAGQPEVKSAEQDAPERHCARGVGPRWPEHGPLHLRFKLSCPAEASGGAILIADHR